MRRFSTPPGRTVLAAFALAAATLPIARGATDADQIWLFDTPAAVAGKSEQARAEAGNRTAQLDYARFLYAQGDKAEAVMWLTEANTQGSLRAQYLLGLLYARGDGVAQDMDQSRYFLGKAAKQHYPPAETALGLQLLDAEFAPTADPDSPDSDADAAAAVTRGAELLRDAASQGYGPAQYRFGLVLWNGTGLPKDPAGALAAFQDASRQGVAEAAYMAATIQTTGPADLRNVDEARRALRHCLQLAPQHSALAQDARKLLDHLNAPGT